MQPVSDVAVEEIAEKYWDGLWESGTSWDIFSKKKRLIKPNKVIHSKNKNHTWPIFYRYWNSTH